MKSSTRLRGACLVLLCVICLSFIAWGVDVIATLSLTPAPIARGDVVLISILLNHSAGTPLENTTLFVPLPVGIDQWKAEVRIDAGPWMVYPANGLIALPQIPAWGQMVVEIQVPIEPASPATLTVTAELLNATGVLAQADGWVNVLPSVDAGPDRIVDLGRSIVLDDASASDGNGLLVGYSWTDHGAGGVFDDSHLLHPTYAPPASSGILELTLTVTDSDGGESNDSLRVRVNAIPQVHVGGDLETHEGIRLPIRNVTITDTDGWIASMVWSDGGAGGTFLPSSTVVDPVYLVPEIEGCDDEQIKLTLEVFDDWGARNTDTLILDVTNINELPILYVSESMEAAPGQRVELSGLAVDQDGHIEVQTWEQVDGPVVALNVGTQERHAWFEAPDVDDVLALNFRFLVVDDCGGSASGDVVVTIIPQPKVDETPTYKGALRVTIDLFDERGLPLSAFDLPSEGDVITIRFLVVNSSLSEIDDLMVTLSDGSVQSLTPSKLRSWQSTSGSVAWLVDFPELMDELEIAATVTGIDERGEIVAASDAVRFAAMASDSTTGLQLIKASSVAEARVDDTIAYDFTIANVGSSDLVGLTLMDDKLGWIPLPSTTLGVGDVISVRATYVVHSSDLPGPITNWALVSGFTRQGDRVEDEASASVELFDLAGGGGGQSSSQGKVVISEIAWAGTLSNPRAEWIELVNVGTTSVDLSGWRVSWYEKNGTVPPPSQWHFIELAGTIDPRQDQAEQEPSVVFVALGNGLWSVEDPRWLRPGASRGTFLLERAHDGVVANVAAGLVYGDDENPYYDLPDSGAAIYLIDPSGSIVDSANAQYAQRDGWPGGNVFTGATMERVNLQLGDFDGNWQTTTGVLTYGEDAAGHGLLATAGMPNSQPLDALLQTAAASMTPTLIPGAWSVLIPETKVADRAMIQTTALASGLAAGGGGGLQAPALDTSRTSQGLVIEMDVAGASNGSYFVWIALKNGQTVVVPIRK